MHIIGVPDKARVGDGVVNLFIELNEETTSQNHAGVEELVSPFCRKYTSPYKVPKVIHFIEFIPPTAVGKIDKKVLREMVVT